MVSEATSEAGDSSTATTTLVKRGINQGIFKLREAMKREYTTVRRTFSTAANQQFYQLPEDAIRPKSITITVGGVVYPLHEVTSELEWRVMNQNIITSDIATHYYVRGADEFGIYPVPATSLSYIAGTSGGEIVYQSRHHQLSADDYTTGTVTVTQDSAAVVGSGTTFTALMVGRSLQLSATGSPDNFWYKIASYTDATHVTLENVYEGLTTATASYTIGEVPDIPEELHYAPVDYALHRFYLRRRDRTQADYYKALFGEAVREGRSSYSRKSTSSIIDAASPQSKVGNFWTRDIGIDV